MIKFAKNKNKHDNYKYGNYPCNDYLNNALRFLLCDDDPHRPAVAHAISEICYCIQRADGKFADDVAEKLKETGLCPYSLDF